MILFRRYKIVITILLSLVIAYILGSFIYGSNTLNKIKPLQEEPKFQISSVLNIDRKRIVFHSAYRLKGDFLCINYLIDNKYYLSISKFGKLKADITGDNFITIKKHDFSNGYNWFGYNNIAYPRGDTDFYQNFEPVYNVSLLPLLEIKNINLYIRGEIISKKLIEDDSIIEYEIKASYISFSFNNLDKKIFAYGAKESKCSLIFAKDTSNNFYIINLAPISDITNKGYVFKAPYKTLKEILEEDSTESHPEHL
jgi:hypothetical protein